MPGVPQHGQQALQEAQGAEVVDVALDARLPFAPAATFGWPASHAAMPSAAAVSPVARAVR